MSLRQASLTCLIVTQPSWLDGLYLASRPSLAPFRSFFFRTSGLIHLYSSSSHVVTSSRRVEFNHDNTRDSHTSNCARGETPPHQFTTSSGSLSLPRSSTKTAPLLMAVPCRFPLIRRPTMPSSSCLFPPSAKPSSVALLLLSFSILMTRPRNENTTRQDVDRPLRCAKAQHCLVRRS